jgi:hypothetical protein
MALRRTLVFWGRVVRYNLSSVGLVRAHDDYRFGPRLLGELVLVAALALGGYLIGAPVLPIVHRYQTPTASKPKHQRP